jgi:hypothetical protein
MSHVSHNFPPSPDDILNLVEGGVSQRIDSFRWELLDWEEAVIGDLTPDIERAPRITNDTTRTIMRSVEGMYLPASETRHIDGIGDKARGWMTLQDGTEFSLGVFLWADDTHPRREWGSEHAASLSDKGLIIDQPYGRTTGSSKNQNTVQRAVDFLRTAIPVEQIDATPYTDLIDAPMTWDPSAKLNDIINDHLQNVGYYPVHFDRDGIAKLKPTPSSIETSETTVPPYGDGGRIERDSIIHTNDLFEAANEFVVYDNSGQGTIKVGRYRIAASNPHSVENRGFVVRHVEAMQGVSNRFATIIAARSLAIKHRKSIFEWITFNTAADPRHDTFDIYDFYDERYLETKWTLECRPGGRMTHEAKKIYD